MILLMFAVWGRMKSCARLATAHDGAFCPPQEEDATSLSILTRPDSLRNGPGPLIVDLRCAATRAAALARVERQ
jgi:hypothetical protein